MAVDAREMVHAAELRAAIEGVYTMAGWYDSTGVAYAPEADGRWVLVDGVFVSLLLKREDDGSKQTIAGLMATGDVGQALNIRPDAGGVQHCEIAGMRDTIDAMAGSLPNWASSSSRFRCSWRSSPRRTRRRNRCRSRCR